MTRTFQAGISDDAIVSPLGPLEGRDHFWDTSDQKISWRGLSSCTTNVTIVRSRRALAPKWPGVHSNFGFSTGPAMRANAVMVSAVVAIITAVVLMGVCLCRLLSEIGDPDRSCGSKKGRRQAARQ